VIYIYNKTTLSRISSYGLLGRGGLIDMVMFAPDVQPPATSKHRRYSMSILRFISVSYLRLMNVPTIN